MSKRFKVGPAAMAVTAATALALACSSGTTELVDDEDAGTVEPAADSGLGIFRFMPATSYSGFDGEHTFAFPIAVYDSAGDLEVSASDPSAVTIEPKALEKPVNDDGTADNGKYFFVTMKKAGTVTLTARSGGQTATGTVTATSYSAASWSAGEARYLNGGQGDPACANCHVNGEAIDHSPAALSTAADDRVASVILTGVTTRGTPIKVAYPSGHKWKVTDDERSGLVTYLRSLTPRGFK